MRALSNVRVKMSRQRRRMRGRWIVDLPGITIIIVQMPDGEIRLERCYEAA